MVPENAKESLLQVVQHTLEEAAFVFTEPQETKVNMPGRCVQASLGFSGLAEGKLVIRAPRSFANLLAANLLGADPEDEATGQMSLAAMGELLNMIGGILIEVWFNALSGYHLGIPEIREIPDGNLPYSDGPAPCSVALTSEERYPIEICAYFK
jgi:hypothetical protein